MRPKERWVSRRDGYVAMGAVPTKKTHLQKNAQHFIHTQIPKNHVEPRSHTFVKIAAKIEYDLVLFHLVLLKPELVLIWFAEEECFAIPSVIMNPRNNSYYKSRDVL